MVHEIDEKAAENYQIKSESGNQSVALLSMSPLAAEFECPPITDQQQDMF
jgi:hypothetical protein